MLCFIRNYHFSNINSLSSEISKYVILFNNINKFPKTIKYPIHTNNIKQIIFIFTQYVLFKINSKTQEINKNACLWILYETHSNETEYYQRHYVSEDIIITEDRIIFIINCMRCHFLIPIIIKFDFL